MSRSIACGPSRRRSVVLGTLLATVAWLTASLGVAAVGPPFPDPVEDRYVYDDAGAFGRPVRRATTDTLRALFDRTGVRLVVYTQVNDASDTPVQVRQDAVVLLDQWELAADGGEAAVLFWDFERRLDDAIVQLVGTEAFHARHLDEVELQAIVDQQLGEDLAAGRWQSALTRAVVAVSLGTSSRPGPGASVAPGASPGPAPSAAPVDPVDGPAPPAGPPFPDPVDGRVVYDFAGVLDPETERGVTATIVGIEDRTGAEIVVYTQVKPESDTIEEAEQDAIALVDQWGVGRAGFDDGLAILFDMDETLRHGQVQLYAGPGYRAAFLTNEERQAIFEDDMLPLLRAGDIDGALLAAMEKIDAAATAEHAATLATARQIDAVVGLVLAPLVFLGLVAWAGSSWLRFGRDPVYLDDPSIHMPAPPPDLTAAAGALIMDGRSSRHTLTTAMLDLASRGEIAFRQQSGVLGLGGKKVGVQLLQPNAADPELARNRRRPLSNAEEYALERLLAIGRVEEDSYIAPDALLRFGTSVDTFDDRLEKHVVNKGWFREQPSKSIERWSFRGGFEMVAGFIGGVIAFNLPSQGLLLLSIAVFAAGVVTLVLARAMPARTMAGAMIFAMLAAYRRTLQKTMEQARSMKQVVDSHAVPWLETPDQALVWGVALGLHGEVEQVLERSVEDAREGRAASGQAWLPVWYGDSSGSFASGSASYGGVAPGLFSSSVVPDFNGMMGALSTIGNAPSSSSSGSGGFSGGSSGGGGGGSGGGF